MHACADRGGQLREILGALLIGRATDPGRHDASIGEPDDRAAMALSYARSGSGRPVGTTLMPIGCRHTPAFGGRLLDSCNRNDPALKRARENHLCRRIRRAAEATHLHLERPAVRRLDERPAGELSEQRADRTGARRVCVHQ